MYAGTFAVNFFLVAVGVFVCILQQIDFIAASFVRKGSDVVNIRTVRIYPVQAGSSERCVS